MLRFLALALPLALLLLALSAATLEALDLAPDPGPLAARGVARPEGLSPVHRLLGWGLEALALVALVLLLFGRTGDWWLDGLTAGAIAWTFRGPLLVLAVAAMTRLPTEPFWQLARGALLTEPAVALVVAGLARAMLPSDSR